MEKDTFFTSSQQEIELPEIVVIIKEFIDQDPESDYALTIGTDSELRLSKNKEQHLEFITAIVIHRKGKGGKYFWKRTCAKKVKTLREKIYQEVLLSLETAHKIVPVLRTKLSGPSNKYELEIHIDVGEKGDTREMIREVVGIVTGSGFIAKTKPFSYAASNIADKLI